MAPRPPSVSSLAVGAVPLVLVPALGAVQGGYLPATWVWATPLAAWAAALGALYGPGALRRGWPWAAAALALLGWTALSTVWSTHASQSWLEARRAVLYAAVVLALVTLARRNAVRTLVLATHAGVSLLLLYALARYLLGRRQHDPFEANLLAQPLGYANAVAILAALGLLLGAGIAARERSPRLRAAAAASLPPIALALSLTGSRGSWAALVAGAAVLVALEAPGRVIRAVAPALPAAILLVALAAVLRLSASDATPSQRDRALVAAAALALTAATAALSRRLAVPRGRHLPRRAVLALLLAAGVVAVGTLVAAGRSEPRAAYWHVAWAQEILPHPALGTGAGTFGRAWVRAGLGPEQGGALDAHSLYVETLAELGPPGLLLVAALLLLPLAGAVRAQRRGLASAATAAYAAFLVHAGLDWDWELPAVVVAALACGGALLLGEDLQPRRPLGATRIAAATAALLLGALGIAGARSGTVPAAAGTEKAPLGGALSTPIRRSAGAG